jgi:hypothetical protein
MELSDLATDDYQKRDGRYPASGKPDVITVRGKTVSLEFKNTSEAAAKKWASNYVSTKGFIVESVTASQDGDYQDDWVSVGVSVK